MMCVYVISVFPQFCGFFAVGAAQKEIIFSSFFFSFSLAVQAYFFHPKSFEFAFPKQYFFNSIDGSFLIGAQIFARAGCSGVYKKCAPIKKDGTIGLKLNSKRHPNSHTRLSLGTQ